MAKLPMNNECEWRESQAKLCSSTLINDVSTLVTSVSAGIQYMDTSLKLNEPSAVNKMLKELYEQGPMHENKIKNSCLALQNAYKKVVDVKDQQIKFLMNEKMALLQDVYQSKVEFQQYRLKVGGEKKAAKYTTETPASVVTTDQKRFYSGTESSHEQDETVSEKKKQKTVAEGTESSHEQDETVSENKKQKTVAEGIHENTSENGTGDLWESATDDADLTLYSCDEFTGVSLQTNDASEKQNNEIEDIRSSAEDTEPTCKAE